MGRGRGLVVVAALVAVVVAVGLVELGLGFWHPLPGCNWIQLLSWKALNPNCSV